MIASRSASHARYKIRQYVLRGSTVYTDDWGGYAPLSRSPHYEHRSINHSQRIYVSGTAHTQTIDGFFGLFKTGVRGAYHSVSKKWLQGYLNEYVRRYNHREDPVAMFRLLLARAAMTS